MPVTRTAVANTFSVPLENVKQIGAKQLFIVDCPRKGRCLVSYKTIVGSFRRGTWYLTTEKYGRTTTIQMTQFQKSTKFPIVYTDDIWGKR